MLTSILSLYIASTLNLDLELGLNSTLKNTDNIGIVKTASFGFSKLANAEPVPIKNQSFIEPIIHAKSSIAIDLATGDVLYEKNAHENLPIASITKLMTILIILEENQLNEVATVSSNAANTEGSTMFLHSGEQIAVENLLYGALIHSANDAAVALAEHNAGSVSEFVKKMNDKAAELGLGDSNFTNPVGLDTSGNYSSAHDVAKLGQLIYQYDFIKHAAGLQELEVRSVSGDLTHKLTSTNDLLDSYLDIKGLKTGHTDLAGLCLTAIAENDSENEILTVVLNSPARFTESKILIDWVFRAYTW